MLYNWLTSHEVRVYYLLFILGGLHGYVSVLYASFTEFLVLYHAEMDTTGSAGGVFEWRLTLN